MSRPKPSRARSSRQVTTRSLAEVNAEQRAAREAREAQEAAQEEEVLELSAELHGPDSLRHRAELGTRLFAFFLDLGLVAGLSSVLVLTLHTLLNDTFKMYGFEFGPVMLSLPVLFLYLSYFSTELTSGMTIGKRLLGVEVRLATGERAPERALLKRTLIKHSGLMMLIGALVSGSIILLTLAFATGALSLLNLAFGFGPRRQCLHDRLDDLAVFPRKLPKTDLRRLAGGRSDREVAAELKKAQAELKKRGSSRSKVPPAEAFPCGAEIKVYTHDVEDIEASILEAFTRFIQNVHPDQVKEFPPKGSYRAFKVVMRFATPLEMEASYEALAKTEGVVTVLPTKLVRLPKQETGWLKRPARPAQSAALPQSAPQGSPSAGDPSLLM